MTYHWLAGGVVLLHAIFVLFVVFGGFLALRWRWLPWLHVPAVIWGVAIEYTGELCPLTPLENSLRMRAGLAGYAGGFIDHYILGRLYPTGLTQRMQYALGTFALLVNVLAYWLLLWRVLRRRARLGAAR
jgi:hypothetical protein